MAAMDLENVRGLGYGAFIGYFRWDTCVLRGVVWDIRGLDPEGLGEKKYPGLN